MEKGNEKGLHTIIGSGTVIEGTIVVPHSVRIDGTLKGKLETTETLTVGSTGRIEADVTARNAIIGGIVQGNLNIQERVELESKSSLVGDLVTRDLVINEGATFHGKCTMDVEKGVKV